MSNAWMVRAGEGSYLIEEFARGYVGIGWNEIGDLSLVNTQEGIRELYLRAFPEEKPGTVGNAAAMIYKFRSMIQAGDKVLTYDSSKREYLVGAITGDYIYKPNEIRDYHHIRKVKWEQRISRDDLSAASRNSLGSIMTLFSVNEDVWADISALLTGKRVAPQDERLEEEKDELAQIKEDVISKAHELIKDKILGLNDEQLEQLSAALLRAMGYRTRVSPKGPDRGVDVLASRDGLGLEEPRIKVEVKHRKKTKMDAPDIRSFLGALRQGDRGLYISTGGFTKEAKYEADRSIIPITLVSLDELASIVVTHYDSFDLEGRTLIPLMRVYWPIE